MHSGLVTYETVHIAQGSIEGSSVSLRWTQIVYAAVKVLCLEHGTDQVAIGTVYKDMKLKPTVLKEYTEDVTMAQQLGADQFCDDGDGLVLEDDTARIKLTGALDTGRMVTGIVMAARGTLDEKTGIFDVTDFCYAGGIL